MEQNLAWNRQRGCDTVAGLNEIVRSGKVKPLVENRSRFMKNRWMKPRRSHEPAEHRRPNPNDVGERTELIRKNDDYGQAHRTAPETGLRFLMLNLTTILVARRAPTDWINDRNYETPEALDIQLLNRHLLALLDGETIEKPVYSFKEGRRLASNT